MTIEKELFVAIQEGQLQAFLQPQVDMNGRVLGAEALVRWQHPEKGMVSPGEFIPVAEDCGLIV
ncbi:MAG: EAL domain-containing protein, partial [Comamonas sp.]